MFHHHDLLAHNDMIDIYNECFNVVVTMINDWMCLFSVTDEEASVGEPIIYKPKMNIERFQRFLASEEERNQTVSSISGPNQASRLEAGPAHSTRLQDSRGLHSTQGNH